MPEAPIPETPKPEAQVPEAQVPEAQVPEVQVPDVQVPEAQMSGHRLAVRKTYKLYLGGAFPRSESGRSYIVAGAGGQPVPGLVVPGIVRRPVGATERATRLSPL